MNVKCLFGFHDLYIKGVRHDPIVSEGFIDDAYCVSVRCHKCKKGREWYCIPKNGNELKNVRITNRKGNIDYD